MPGSATLNKGYLGSSLVVGGVRYMRDHDVSDIPGLTVEEIAFYRQRGIINDRRIGDRGSLLRNRPGVVTKAATVGPMTVGDGPNAPAPAPAPAPTPAPSPAPAPTAPPAASGATDGGNIDGGPTTDEARAVVTDVAAQFAARQQAALDSATGARKPGNKRG